MSDKATHTLKGEKFSNLIANCFMIEHMYKSGQIERRAGETELLRLFDLMDRMIAGEYDAPVDRRYRPIKERTGPRAASYRYSSKASCRRCSECSACRYRSR